MRTPKPVEPTVLIEVAIACLKARVEHADRTGGEEIDPVLLLSRPDRPSVLDGCTKAEVVEACGFLRRMGIIEPVRRRAA
jgi:hypothetical protein